MKKVNLAIIGATGMVGAQFIKILKERNFPIDNIYFFSSGRSAGKKISFNGQEHIVEELTETSFDRPIDIGLFSAGGTISGRFAPILAAKGGIAIDNSSHFRMNPDVPLIVPEVNPEDVGKHKGIIANPNCSTIQAVVALAPLHQPFGIKRIIFSTYQAVSGSGMAGWQDLENGIKGQLPQNYPHPIAHNIIPQVDVFTENGYTAEELKMINETRKILNAPGLGITATCVRVPVFNGHSESINVEFENIFEIEDVIETLKNAPGVVVQNDAGQYPTPMMADGSDKVFVGRIRRDASANAINMWVVADNIRKGAATNTVQIAELVLKNLK
ncbi:MAG: aspartate-semialdehyde dehydrogenase [Defluviitaleaceae bacterium]|nr:aspartate-semialdehyde dehydrogenase [Defluviitaleaceae bacterium]